jgi:hypothetical protein
MKYRKLRIAWSVTWGILCLLGAALWVRSYWQYDNARFALAPANDLLVSSYKGRVIFILESNGIPWQSTVRELGINWLPSDAFFYKRASGFTSVIIPVWFAVLLFAGIGAIPWVRYRFSLRTLLVAMTLVAVVLGALVISMR